jgi:hypothetical protein
LKYGKVNWYRYNKPVLTKPVPIQANAPQSALTEADLSLTSLRKASTFPPDVNNDEELEQLRKEWESAGAKLEALRQKYPEDPQVLRRVAGSAIERVTTLEFQGRGRRRRLISSGPNNYCPKRSKHTSRSGYFMVTAASIMPGRLKNNSGNRFFMPARNNYLKSGGDLLWRFTIKESQKKPLRPLID